MEPFKFTVCKFATVVFLIAGNDLLNRAQFGPKQEECGEDRAEPHRAASPIGPGAEPCHPRAGPDQVGPGRRLPHMVARPGHRRRAFLGISPDLLISGIRSDAPATPIQTAPTQSSRSQLPRYCPHIFHVHCAQYIPKVAFYTTNPIPFMAKPCGVRPNCTQLELREHNMEL